MGTFNTSFNGILMAYINFQIQLWGQMGPKSFKIYQIKNINFE